MLFADKVTENKDLFLRSVQVIANDLEIKADWLMALMYHESGLNSHIVNSMGCVGLIQFCPVVYRDSWGVSQDFLKNISNVRQLYYVKKYLSAYKGKMKEPIDVFLAAFYPYALVNNKLKKLRWKFGSEKSNDYAKLVKNWNPDFDVNNDGVITSKDYIKYHNEKFKKWSLKTYDYTNKTALFLFMAVILTITILFVILKSK